MKRLQNSKGTALISNEMILSDTEKNVFTNRHNSMDQDLTDDDRTHSPKPNFNIQAFLSNEARSSKIVITNNMHKQTSIRHAAQANASKHFKIITPAEYRPGLPLDNPFALNLKGVSAVPRWAPVNESSQPQSQATSNTRLNQGSNFRSMFRTVDSHGEGTDLLKHQENIQHHKATFKIKASKLVQRTANQQRGAA